MKIYTVDEALERFQSKAPVGAREVPVTKPSQRKRTPVPKAKTRPEHVQKSDLTTHKLLLGPGLSTPGQVPGHVPQGVRARLDPELEHVINGKPPGWSLERALELEPRTARDVVKGLGLSKAMENRLVGIVSREILTNDNRVALAKAVVGVMLQEAVPHDVRLIVSRRALKLHQKALRKGGGAELFRPEEFQKAGFKYVAKIEHGGKGKPTYFYDEKKYQAKHGIHVSGAEGNRRHLSKRALQCVGRAGGECGIDGFKDLVKKHGAKEVHAAVRAAVDSGELDYANGKFRARGAKKEKRSA